MRRRSAVSEGEPARQRPRKVPSKPQGGCERARAAAAGVVGEVDGEEGELTRQVRVLECKGAADPVVAFGVGYDGGAEELVPIGRSDSERRQDDGPNAVGSGLGHEGVEERRRRKGEQGFPIGEAAGGADGAVPVGDGEGVLGLGSMLSVPGEEARDEAIGLGRKCGRR